MKYVGKDVQMNNTGTSLPFSKVHDTGRKVTKSSSVFNIEVSYNFFQISQLFGGIF